MSRGHQMVTVRHCIQGVKMNSRLIRKYNHYRLTLVSHNCRKLGSKLQPNVQNAKNARGPPRFLRDTTALPFYATAYENTSKLECGSSSPVIFKSVDVTNCSCLSSVRYISSLSSCSAMLFATHY